MLDENRIHLSNRLHSRICGKRMLELEKQMSGQRVLTTVLRSKSVLLVYTALVTIVLTGHVNATTWSAPAALNPNASTDGSGSDERPSIATDGNGNWVSVWSGLQAATGPEYDMFSARSSTNGSSWTGLTTVNTDAASD